MRHDDPQSLNLFSRLAHYVPSEGEKLVRHPLEDFCTEALAFCLMMSDSFRKRFISELLQKPDSAGLPTHVHTQHVSNDGRADLVFENIDGRKSQQWIIEVKFWADIRDTQRHYADYILAPEAYFRLRNKKLPKGAGTFSWEKVQGLLLGCALEKTAEVESCRFVMKQFAEFLGWNEYSQKFMKTDAYKITDIKSALPLFSEWTDFLNTLRDVLDLKERNKKYSQPYFEPANKITDSSWYGIYGPYIKDIGSFYAAFEVTPKAEIFCFYQEFFKGSKPTSKEFIIEVGKKNSIRITKKTPYPKGSKDKVDDVRKIFLNLKKSIRDFATLKKLRYFEPNGSK